jgi:predicted transcriptional regulator
MSADPDIPWNLVAQVRRSQRKKEIIERLANDPASATEISDEIELERESISNVIRELKNTDPALITCLTPKQPHHQLYGLTDIGAAVYEHV